MNYPEQNAGEPLESSDSLPSLRHNQEELDACVETSGRLTIDDAPKRPKAIIVGIWIIMGFTVIAFFSSLILFVFSPLPLKQSGSLVMGMPIILVVNIFLCKAISHEENWARVVMLMLSSLNLLADLLSIILDPAISQEQLSYLIGPFVFVVGSFCFFTPAANKWFRMWG